MLINVGSYWLVIFGYWLDMLLWLFIAGHLLFVIAGYIPLLSTHDSWTMKLNYYQVSVVVLNSINIY